MGAGSADTIRDMHDTCQHNACTIHVMVPENRGTRPTGYNFY